MQVMVALRRFEKGLSHFDRAFMALPRTYAIGGMIRVALFTGVLKRWFGLWPERLNALVALIAFGALAWVTGNEALARFAARETTLGTVQFPMYWSFV